jgi:hypothetical protein
MKKILATFILAGSTLMAGPRFAFGVGIGVPVPAPVVGIGVAPGPGYFWTPGYYYFAGGHRLWHAGSWAPPVARFGRGFRR